MVLCTCSLDYGFSANAQGPETPNIVFRDFQHNVVIDGRRIFEVRADLAEVYAESRKTILSGVSFSEYDQATGEPVSTGKADNAVLYTDTEDAEFTGAIRIDSSREDAIVEAEYLAWDASEKRLESRLDRTVSISRSDGSWVRGAGFSADARRRSFSFREAAEGRIFTGEAETGATSLPESDAGAASPSAPSPSQGGEASKTDVKTETVPVEAQAGGGSPEPAGAEPQSRNDTPETAPLAAPPIPLSSASQTESVAMATPATETPVEPTAPSLPVESGMPQEAVPAPPVVEVELPSDEREIPVVFASHARPVFVVLEDAR